MVVKYQVAHKFFLVPKLRPPSVELETVGLESWCLGFYQNVFNLDIRFLTQLSCGLAKSLTQARFVSIRNSS